MEKEEVLNKARSDHSRQEPRRQLLERNAGYLSFIAVTEISLLIQTRQIRYLALALFFLLLPAIMSWRIFCG